MGNSVSATMAMQLAECAAMFMIPGTDLRRSADEELKITDTCEYSFAVKQRGTPEDGMASWNTASTRLLPPHQL